VVESEGVEQPHAERRRFRRYCPVHHLELIPVLPSAHERYSAELVCPADEIHYIHRSGRTWYWQVVDTWTGEILYCASEMGICSVGPMANGLPIRPSPPPPDADPRRRPGPPAWEHGPGRRPRRVKRLDYGAIPVHHLALPRRRSESSY